jgi:hypothetical protein
MITCDKGLVAYYPFNGNANDERGNENHGVVHEAALAEDRFENKSSAYHFGAETDNINVNHSESLNLDAVTGSYSVNVWAKVDSPARTGGGVLIAKDGTPGYSFKIYEVDTFGIRAMAWDYTIDNGPVISMDNFYDNQWHFLSYVVDHTSDSVYIYRDGELVAKCLNTVQSAGSNDWSLTIGNGWARHGEFNGSIDDIRIYNRTLSNAEINTLYNEKVLTTLNTMVIYDTIPVNKYISVTDTLIINAELTGVDSPQNHNTIKAYPNPTRDRITIDNGDYTKMTGYQLKILNNLGSVVFESEINKIILQ